MLSLYCALHLLNFTAVPASKLAEELEDLGRCMKEAGGWVEEMGSGRMNAGPSDHFHVRMQVSRVRCSKVPGMLSN